MKKIVKLVHVNDGEKNEVNNGDFLLVENYPRTEKIINAFLSDGWTLNSITQQVTPAVQKQGAYTFYMGGFNLLFEKEVDDLAEDNGDMILEEAVSDVLEDESGEEWEE